MDCEHTTDLSKITREADVVIIAVRDSVIADVSEALPVFDEKTVVAHTAGSIPSEVLSRHTNHGVFYPLQTFSTDGEVAWDVIPLLLTANNKHAHRILESLADSVNDNGQFITDNERLHLHLCATIANNFANHMFALAKQIADKAHLDFDLLKPLIRETADKVTYMDPEHAQTGPALRGDQVTMDKHLALLGHDPQLRQLYRMISESIRSK